MAQEPLETNGLIEVVQLPVIAERLHGLKAELDGIAQEAMQMEATEATVREVKARRAEIAKIKDELESRRKAVKTAVMAPYMAFDQVYDECVRQPIDRCLADLKAKVDDVEWSIRNRCEAHMRDYFDEAKAAMNLDWVQYEQCGLKIGLTDAKQKTPKKLMTQIMDFLARVTSDVDTIASMENADEILAEYKQSLSLAQAIGAVADRQKRIEQAGSDVQGWLGQDEEEHEAVEILRAEEPKLTLTLEITATRNQMVALRDYLKANGIEYRQRR